MNSKNKKLTKTAFYHLFIVLFGLAMIYPVIWMIIGSFKTNSQILNSVNIFEGNYILDNYRNGWKGFGNISFLTFFKNSFVVTFFATLGTTLSSTLVAYAFSRIKFKGSKIWFVCMLSTLMLPSQLVLIPQYIIFMKLKLINTYVPLVLPHFLGQAFFIYMVMQFMAGIPKELDESAFIDGCNKYSIFSRIIFPLISPAVITTIIIQFYWKWDEFLQPLIYLNKPAKYTASLAIKMFADATSTTDYGAMFAMATLSLVPVFGIFLAFNRNLMEGISSSGLKG